MLIVCPSCASRYSIDDDKIGPSGRTVRCAGCRTGFFVSLADDRSDARAPEAQPEPPPPPATVAPPPPPSADDDVAAQWLAEMERDGTPVQGAEPEEPVPQAQDLDNNLDGNPDNGSLDALFEAEMAAANLEAEAAMTEAGGAGEAVALAPVTGWRSFLPRRRDKNSAVPSKPAKPDKKAARSAARGPSRSGALSTNGKHSALARLKGPLGLGLAGALILMGAVFQRQTVVRLLPSSAGLFSAIGLSVNLRGLEFADVRSTSLSEGEARFLVVEGSVRSVHHDTVQVPLIEISLRGEDGRTLYTWTAEPPRKSLKSGEALHFRTRLATPPEAGRNVEVRFSNKQQSAKAGS